MPISPVLLEAVALQDRKKVETQLKDIDADYFSSRISIALADSAIQNQDQEMLNLLETAGLPVNTIILQAAQWGNIPILAYYLNRGINFTTIKNENFERPMNIAVKFHQMKALEFLLNQKVSDKSDNSGVSALTLAQLMKEQKAIDLINKFDSTPEFVKTLFHLEFNIKDVLMRASEHNRTDLLALVAQHDALALRGEAGTTQLHKAARAGNLPLVIWFIEHGVDINIDDISGFTPLFHAVAGKHPEVTDYLLSKGAKTNIKDLGGRTLDDLKSGPLTDVSQGLLNKKLRDFLKLTHRDDESVIRKAGNCSGWEFLYMFTRQLTGNNTLFYDIVTLIAEWDGTEASLYNMDLSPALKKYTVPFNRSMDPLHPEIIINKKASLFEYVCYFISMAQTSAENYVNLKLPAGSMYPQFDRPRTFDLISPLHSDMHVNQLFGFFNRTYNQAQLTEILKMFSAWPGLTVALYGEGHTTSLLVNEDGSFEYYDSNQRYPTLPFKSSEALAEHLFKFFLKKTDKETAAKIEFGGFQYNLFNEPDRKAPQGNKQYPSDSVCGMTRLHYAVFYRDLDEINRLLAGTDAKALLSTEDTYGYLPMMMAIESDQKELFFTFFDALVSHQLQDLVEYAAAYLVGTALIHKSAEKLGWFKSIIDTHAFDPTLITSTFVEYEYYIHDYFKQAINTQNKALLKLLVETGMDVNVAVELQDTIETPLKDAIRAEDPTSIAYLLSLGANPNIPNASVLSQKKHIIFINSPLKIAININAADKRYEILSLLINAKVDLNELDKEGKMVLVSARPEVKAEIDRILKERNKETQQLQSKPDTRKRALLHTEKADVTREIKKGKSVLTQEEQKTSAQVMQEKIKRFEKPDAKPLFPPKKKN